MWSVCSHSSLPNLEAHGGGGDPGFHVWEELHIRCPTEGTEGWHWDGRGMGTADGHLTPRDPLITSSPS